jgi:hypothetical protein
MKSKTTFKCLNCNEKHACDPRNRGRQHYCSKPECRRASKAASQRKCLGRPENQNYFRGTDNCERVRRWREAHPGCWPVIVRWLERHPYSATQIWQRLCAEHGYTGGFTMVRDYVRAVRPARRPAFLRVRLCRSVVSSFLHSRKTRYESSG